MLWSVLQRGSAQGGDPRARLRRTVTGRDGYVAVLALAEIDPEFEGKRVILAYRRDGQPLPQNELRLVPGDHRGGRSVREVVRIELR
jgi:DMSO/TMAO reductase YedYZ molybdopterin-dependent catalytic subunit